MALLSVTGAGCIGSEADPRLSGAVGAVTSTASLRTLWQGLHDPPIAQHAMTQMGDFGSFLALLAAPPAAVGQMNLVTQAESFPGCVRGATDGSDGSATFNNCANGNFTINGIVTKTGDNFAAELTLSLSSPGLVGTVSYSGSVTATATLLDGSLTLGINLTAAGQSYALNVTVDFERITLCQNGTLPSGGTLSASGSGSSGTANFNRSVTARFGPGCGEARIGGS